MKLARIVGRVFCARQYETLDKKKLLLIQPLDWETQEPKGEPLVAVDAVGSGASEKVFWVASREAAVAFPDLPPVDAAVVGIVEGSQVRDFRGETR
ncbi:MAG TPA: EutN/CcmL family microcompartment protein [Elusimicrobiota bacterium]|jgi:microcompartment protein CcmK/EutM|nr:EutN/CcmL family microcompartment protein [Elusimicrobiota bacterium]